MRVFIGIGMPSMMKAYLRDVQSQVLSVAIKSNPTHIDNVHLTLKYIGEIDGNTLSDLCQILDEKLSEEKAFDIRLGDIGHFIKGKEHVVWVGILEGNQKLSDLAFIVSKGVSMLGLIGDKKSFNPHITISRQTLFNGYGTPVHIPYNPKRMTVDKVTIFKSHRVREKLTYTPLYEINLKAGGQDDQKQTRY